MAKKIGVAVIGLGYAGKQHLDAYLKNSNVEVKKICDQSKETAVNLSGKIGIPYTSDYHDIIADKQIEIVSICTPDFLHCEQSLAAINAGKHVFCEKPLAPSFEECEKIVEAVGKKRVKFLTGQVLRFAPLFQSLKKIAQSEMIGRPFFAESDYIHDIRPFLGGWRINPDKPGDLILGGGCHPVDLLRWIIGDIREMYACGNKISLVDTPFPADNILISVKFENGVLGKVQIIAGCRRPYALNLSVYGTKGTLINNKLFTEEIDLLENFIDLPLPQKAEYQYYDREIEELLNAIGEDRDPSVSAVDGANTVAACLAAISSVKKNEPVEVKKI